MALFGCFRLQNFPAWVVSSENKLLGLAAFFVHHKDRIVAVSERGHDTGIRVGWTPQRALSLVPDAVGVPLDISTCAYAWRQVVAKLYEHTPRIEIVREGMAYIEVPTRKEQQQALSQLVCEMNAQCGIANSRIVAELAALQAVPGKIFPVSEKQVNGFLDFVPVEALVLAGISEVTVERLKWFGWGQLGSLRDVENRYFLEQFEDGALVARYAAAGSRKSWAQETAPIRAYVPPPVITARILFDVPATEPCEWEPALPELIKRACGALNGQETASLTLIAITSKGRKAGSCLLRESMNEPRRLLNAATDLSRSLIPACDVHSLEVELGSLGVHLHQEELWETNRHRQSKILDSILQLKSRGISDVIRFRLRDAFASKPEEAFETVLWLDTPKSGQPAGGRVAI